MMPNKELISQPKQFQNLYYQDFLKFHNSAALLGYKLHEIHKLNDKFFD